MDSCDKNSSFTYINDPFDTPKYRSDISKCFNKPVFRQLLSIWAPDLPHAFTEKNNKFPNAKIAQQYIIAQES